MNATEQPLPKSAEDAYVGALDGLRAIAVAAVVVFHFAPSLLPAGFLGVDVFFVVSGFLIARLVTREIGRSGTVSLGNFWSRRARRLLPALATVTVVVLVAAALRLSDAELHDIRAQALGTLFYCANWVMIFAKNNYFTRIGRPSPFLHMWTLAVEEQFYLLLPLAMFAVRRVVVRRPVLVATVALAGAIASTVWMGVLVSPAGDPSRAYLGSDSHAMSLLVGVALGVLAASPGPWQSFGSWMRAGSIVARAAPMAAIASLAGIVVSMRVVSDRTLALYRGGFLAFALLCAVVIAVVVSNPDTPISRFLRAPALVAVGLRSYSLYLWHWPVRVFVTSSTGFDGIALFAVRLAVSIALTEITFRVIEQPFRVGRVARRSGSRGALTYFTTLTLVATALVATVDAPKALPPTNLAKVREIPGNNVPQALRVDTFGDSTALVFGFSGAVHASALGITVGGDAQLGCGVVQTDHVSRGRIIGSPLVCADWRARWQAALRNDPKARLMLMTGAWEILDQDAGAGTVRFGTADWTNLVASSLRAALALLTADGRTAYLFEVPCYGAGDVANPFPERSDPLRIAALNQIYADVARSMPRVEIVHWRTLVCPNGRRAESVDGIRLWQADDQHLTSEGAVVVWKWWLAQLRALR